MNIFGYLYHLDAMEDPFWHSYPAKLKDVVGPRNLLHTFATDTDDPTVEPRWGKIGKQRIVDEGPLPPHPMPGIKYNMETVDEDILDHTVKFIDKAEKDGKPFFVWLNPTRVHVISHLSPKYAAKLTGENGWYLEEGVMSQLDDVVGGVLAKLKADGSKTIRSSPSPPTTGRKTSPGPTAAIRPSPPARERSWKAACGCR